MIAATMGGSIIGVKKIVRKMFRERNFSVKMSARESPRTNSTVTPMQV